MNIMGALLGVLGVAMLVGMAEEALDPEGTAIRKSTRPAEAWTQAGREPPAAEERASFGRLGEHELSTFAQITDGYAKLAKKAADDRERGQYRRERGYYLCNMLKSKDFAGWPVKVSRIMMTSDAAEIMNVQFKITDNVTIDHMGMNIGYDHPAFDPLMKVKKGDVVIISGSFEYDTRPGDSITDCFREGRFGVDGGLTKPEFSITLDSVRIR